MPRVRGAGKNGGLIQTVVGAVLIVVGVMTSWAGGGALVAAGIGMVAGGVAQMLTKPPKMKEYSGTDAGRNSAFSNLSNTAAQGRPMPLAYGRVYAGSRVVSQGVESRRLNGAAATAPNGQKYHTDFADDSVRACKRPSFVNSSKPSLSVSKRPAG